MLKNTQREYAMIDDEKIRELRVKCEVRLIDLKTKLLKLKDPDEIDNVKNSIEYNQDIILSCADLDKDYCLEN